MNSKNTGQPDKRTPYEKMTDLAGKVISVPKSKIEKQSKKKKN